MNANHGDETMMKWLNRRKLVTLEVKMVKTCGCQATLAWTN
ncbi:unnamed protein product [Haemonchus placei]|uniref:Pyruvate kinase n=1 Tax=Haemonchus placei TaxID=6290 RepID=A0A0N4WRF0_HAEPC|nr:unnamed protein product [Haemonchus placei]